MSANRYEITDAGPQVLIDGLDISQRANSTVRAAIRQQAHDLALLTQMLHDQRLVIDDLEHRRVKVCDENDQLRTDLAAAVAENAALLAANRDCILHFDAIKADYDVMKLRAEQAEARLAAIDGAPAIARIESLPGPRGGAYLYIIGVESPPNVSSGTELIARPAKD